MTWSVNFKRLGFYSANTGKNLYKMLHKYLALVKLGFNYFILDILRYYCENKVFVIKMLCILQTSETLRKYGGREFLVVEGGYWICGGNHHGICAYQDVERST